MTYITRENFILPKETQDYYGLDTETTGLEVYTSKVRLLQIANPKERLVYDLFKLDDEHKKQLKDFLESHKFYIHNALFDVPLLMQTFHIKYITCMDTLIMYSLVLKATYTGTKSTIKFPKSLRIVMKVLFDVEISKEEQTSDWSRADLSSEQIQYAELDPLYAYMIGNKLKTHEALQTLNFKLTCASINALARMKLTGIKIDVPRLDALIDEWQEKVDESYKECLIHFKDININSSVQLGNWLEKNVDKKILDSWERTEKTNRLNTDAEALKNHVREVPKLLALVEYKKYYKYLSTYGDNIKAFINPVSGRIHGDYKLAFTDTGRLSSMKPNIQNFPREEWYRSIFIPEKKNVLVCADYSQVEVRVAAILSGEERMLKAYREGKDLYKHTASLLLHKPESEITKAERQQAKAVVLGLQFGMGASTLCKYALNYNVVLTEAESKKLVDGYRQAYPMLYEWQLNTTALAKETLMCETVCGMKRKLDDDNYYTCSLNTPVQGSSAEVILYALWKLDKEICDNNIPARIVATVHDEVLVECDKRVGEKVRDMLSRVMLEAFRFVFNRIGIKGADANIVEAHIGGNWYEAK